MDTWSRTSKTVKNVTCAVIGHRYQDMEWYYDNTCSRCGKWFHQEDPLGSLNLNLVWYRITDRVDRIKRYLSKCHDCGQRFNKHNDDCPPF